MDHPLVSSSSSLYWVVKIMPPEQRRHFIHTNHVKRVALDMVRHENRPPEQVSIIKSAALTHDLAKVLKPYEELYSHQRTFTLPEKHKSKSHPYASAKAVWTFWDEGKLTAIDFEVMVPSLVVIAGHHWWWRDSFHHYRKFIRQSQYKSIHLEEICRDKLHDSPLDLLRILKVADYFVACQERRGYNKPISSAEEALMHMRCMVRTQFSYNALKTLSEVVQSKKHSKALSA